MQKLVWRVVVIPWQLQPPLEIITADYYVDSAADSSAFDEFNDLFTKLTNNINSNDVMANIDVELIEMCVKHLKSGKAAGADRLVAEHITHAAYSLKSLCSYSSYFSL